MQVRSAGGGKARLIAAARPPRRPPAGCPHCQRFQPTYEEVATFFAHRAGQEPVVTVARVDCAEYVSAQEGGGGARADLAGVPRAHAPAPAPTPLPRCCCFRCCQAGICSAFEVQGYPTMRIGRASDLAAMAVGRVPLLQPATRTAEGIVAALEEHIGT